MARCQRTEQLLVHHKRRDGGNDLDNAVVLCQACCENAPNCGAPGASSPPFSHETRLRAYHWARYQCECTSDCPGCLTLSAEAGLGHSFARA